jgi:hypothetical protein
MSDDSFELAKQLDAMYWHLAFKHGYDFAETPICYEWSDFGAMNTLHDELHRRGDYGPLGRHRNRHVSII